MIAIIVMITFTDGGIYHRGSPRMPGENRIWEDEQREKARKNRTGGRMIEKESDGEKRRPSLQSDRSHPIFSRSRSRSRRIESTSDILRRLSLTSRVHHWACLYRRYWQPSFDEARRGGWLGSSAIQDTDVCACSRLRCMCVYARVSITAHLFPSIRLSVDRSVDESVRPAWARKRERETAAGGLGFVRYQIPR